MTLNGVMAVTLRYFTEFGKHTSDTCVDLWRNLCTSLLYFVVRVRCRRKESSRSLSHLLMSFLLKVQWQQCRACAIHYVWPAACSHCRATYAVPFLIGVNAHSRNTSKHHS